jgi:hypothetical protein
MRTEFWHPTPAAIADHLDQLIAEAEPQQAKALLRNLIAELKVESRAKIDPTYRVVTDTVCATSEKVEAAGIEPRQIRPNSRRRDIKHQVVDRVGARRKRERYANRSD